jgi:tagatose 1,6-diphosphate aldolase GatY/KbaY
MLVTMTTLLRPAMAEGYAIGAFNVYNLEGVRAVIAAAEAAHSPAMLQLHPAALHHGGKPLVALCLEAARTASVPIAVHLDHSASPADIEAALSAGLTSVMADGSHLCYRDNLAFTRDMAARAQAHEAAIEAELGRLSGSEDALSVPEYEARLTDPEQAADFVTQTHIDALAVCIGNVHGRYQGKPRLDFERLAAIRQTVAVPLVLHGASGLPEALVQRAIRLGVRKFNVNTEVREAYVATLRQRLQAPQTPDLLDLMQEVETAMQTVIAAKLRLFGSVGKAAPRGSTSVQE